MLLSAATNVILQFVNNNADQAVNIINRGSSKLDRSQCFWIHQECSITKQAAVPQNMPGVAQGVCSAVSVSWTS